MKMLSILAAVAAAGLAVPAATAVAAPAPATISAPKAVEMQRWGHHRKRAYWRTVCTTKWRHHHRVRVCRKVRAWR